MILCLLCAAGSRSHLTPWCAVPNFVADLIRYGNTKPHNKLTTSSGGVGKYRHILHITPVYCRPILVVGQLMSWRRYTNVEIMCSSIPASFNTHWQTSQNPVLSLAVEFHRQEWPPIFLSNCLRFVL